MIHLMSHDKHEKVLTKVAVIHVNQTLFFHIDGELPQICPLHFQHLDFLQGLIARNTVPRILYSLVPDFSRLAVSPVVTQLAKLQNINLVAYREMVFYCPFVLQHCSSRSLVRQV